MNKESLASLSLILSLASVAVCPFQVISNSLSAIAIIYGVKGLKSKRRCIAIVGLIIGILSLVSSVIYFSYCAYWSEYNKYA